MALYDLGNPIGAALGAYRDIVALQDHARQRRESSEQKERRLAVSKIAGAYFTRGPDGKVITRDEGEVLKDPLFLEGINSPVYQQYLKQGITDPRVDKVQVAGFHQVGTDQQGQPIHAAQLQWLDSDGNVISEGPATTDRGNGPESPVHLMNLSGIHSAIMSDLHGNDPEFAKEVDRSVMIGQANRLATMLRSAKTPEERRSVEDFAVQQGLDLGELGKAAGLAKTALSANGVKITTDPYGNESFGGVDTGLQRAALNAEHQVQAARAATQDELSNRYFGSALARTLAEDQARNAQDQAQKYQQALGVEQALTGQQPAYRGPSVDTPHDADAAITQAAIDNNLDPRLLKAVGLVESGLNPNAVSPKGARGAFQFMPATADQYGVTDPHDVAQAAQGAARYLRDLHEMFGGDTDKALTAYNLGPGALMKALRSGEPLPKEAAEYAGKVRAAMTPAPSPSAEPQAPAPMTLAERAQLRAAGLKPDEVQAKRLEQAADDYASRGGHFRQPERFVPMYAKMGPDARARVRGELGQAIMNPRSPEEQDAARARLLEADFADGRISGTKALAGAKPPKPATFDDVKPAVTAGVKQDDVTPLTTEGYTIFGALNGFIAANGERPIAQTDDAAKGAAASATREAWALQQRDPEYVADNLVGPLYYRNRWRNQYRGGTMDSAEDYVNRVVLPLTKASEAAAPTTPGGMTDRLRMTTALISKGMGADEAIQATLKYEQDPNPVNDAVRAKTKGKVSADDVFSFIAASHRSAGSEFFGGAAKRELEKLRTEFRAAHPDKGPGLPSGDNIRSVGGLLKGLSGLPDALPKMPVYGATR
ncbi:transglycosylase SLT domain-containing protein [Methylococcus sp. ANG]|uniref:transglycosylase SLT domain-containing protein n=1 Tax=Methylococcus sp. ANG TaxID=3231903 RepID=UPI003459F276